MASAGLHGHLARERPHGFYNLVEAATNRAAPTYAGSTHSTHVVFSSLRVSVVEFHLL